jgi:hypothetical protein
MMIIYAFRSDGPGLLMSRYLSQTTLCKPTELVHLVGAAKVDAG